MAERTRLVIKKQFSATHYILGEGESRVSIPINGIEGLAALGMASLITAQADGGPKTLEYTLETARLFAEYASVWKPGESSGILKKRFQLARALYQINVAKSLKTKKPPSPFMDSVRAVLKFTDAERSVVATMPQFATVIATFNTPAVAAERNDEMDKKIAALTD